VFNTQGESQQCLINSNNNFRLTRKYTETLLSIPFNIECPQNIEETSTTQLNYQAFIDQLGQHKLLLSWQAATQRQAMLDSNNQVFNLTTKNHSVLPTASFYFWQGILHIWFGFDHLIFVLLLMLPLAKKLFSTPYSELNTSNLTPVLIPSLKLVTGFTLAHSITLCISAFGWSNLPIHWIEAGIALSVVLTALDVIFGWVKKLFWITFLFGLLHGLGFASALGNLGINQEFQLVSILFFNLGVEAGQLLFILALIPVFLIAKRLSALRRYGVNTCATLTLAVGVIWFLERVGV
jgi:hypothetical protein